ncbi:MAG: hypothetical protein B7Z13_13105 [Caulobacterales bacterium 32-67-6]|nr:MAG: hypothetical protein B7Z13_13105 [Caulobacterales bacterium 32-67-6]
MRVFQQNPVLAYGLAVLSSALAFYVRWLLDGDLPPGFPYLTFFPAVILTAFLGGLGPGILCAVLSGLAAWWFFIPPVGFGLSGASALTLVFFAFVVAVDIIVIELMRRALLDLRREQDLTAQLYERQRVMFSDLCRGPAADQEADDRQPPGCRRAGRGPGTAGHHVADSPAPL